LAPFTCRNYRDGVGEDVFRLMRDTFYVTVGFGVLGVQKLQVRRRELERTIAAQCEGPREQLGRLLGNHQNGARPERTG
jgi:hypothetical protein